MEAIRSLTRDGVTFYHLRDFSSHVGLSHFQRAAQHPNAIGRLRRGADLNAPGSSVTLYADATLLVWLCDNYKCSRPENVRDIREALKDEVSLSLVSPKAQVNNIFTTITTPDGVVWAKLTDVCRVFGFKSSRVELPEECLTTYAQISHGNHTKAIGVKANSVLVNQLGIDLLVTSSKKPIGEKMRELILGKVLNDACAYGRVSITEEEQRLLLSVCIQPPRKKTRHDRLRQIVESKQLSL